MEMIQLGMSAGEIKQVLEAKMGKGNSALGDLLGSLPQFRMAGAFSKTQEKS
jgi:hypothetical protein